MKKLWYRIALSALALVTLSTGSLVLGVADGLSHESRAARIDGFPLWRSLGTDRFAVLGRGHIHGGKWEVFATAQARRNPRREPCLTVARISHDARVGAAGGCGAPAPLDGPLSPPVHPTITESSFGVNGHLLRAASYMAMSVAPPIRHVELKLVPRLNSESGSHAQDLSIPTKSLSAAQGRKAGLKQFRFVALAIPRDVCLAQVTGFDAAGTQVFSAVTGECGSGRNSSRQGEG